ncbi:MAG: phasin family protein [Xanthomonadales bacterium]|nr:phasin family protein [Xanthomonadales bacterium]
MAAKTTKKKVLKKKVAKKTQAKPAVADYAAPVIESARDIWLAGLGAFSIAQAESGKMIEQGNKLFKDLVSEGAKLEKKTREVAETAVGDIKGEVESRVGAVRQQAADNWDKLENVFEDRVARVLAQLGVPTASDVNKLSERVAILSKQVSEIGKPAAKPRKKAAKKTASKAAAK